MNQPRTPDGKYTFNPAGAPVASLEAPASIDLDSPLTKWDRIALRKLANQVEFRSAAGELEQAFDDFPEVEGIWINAQPSAGVYPRVDITPIHDGHGTDMSGTDLGEAVADNWRFVDDMHLWGSPVKWSRSDIRKMASYERAGLEPHERFYALDGCHDPFVDEAVLDAADASDKVHTMERVNDFFESHPECQMLELETRFASDGPYVVAHRYEGDEDGFGDHMVEDESLASTISARQLRMVMDSPFSFSVTRDEIHFLRQAALRDEQIALYDLGRALG